ncbi:hypothetical protein PCIT_a1077 [Pseudoalteromonas citrea]|uniref:Uncharacterized protein n=1 Tax=Pseudoalteromonas citrea TaxID=43655 RepID=A0AAD4AM06_9GAMM|nr:hypothetical protein PCIT_a1077 [Pseudoalteromonas citrea]
MENSTYELFHFLGELHLHLACWENSIVIDEEIQIDQNQLTTTRMKYLKAHY